MSNKKQKPTTVPPAPTPLDPLSAEGLTAMKQVSLQPMGILISTQDLDAVLGIIRIYATEIERLKSAKTPAKS